MILFNLFEPLLGKAVSAPFVSAPSSYEDESSKKSSKSSSTKLDKGLGILNEDIVKLLSSGKLLPGDVAKFMDEALNIITYAYDPESGRTSLAPYKMLFTRLSQMQTGYQEWEDVMKKASQNGTLSETAISAQGRVYVMDPLAGLMTKSISLVTSNDRTLTNEELLKARKEDPSFAYNTGLFTTIANAVNPKDITDLLLKVIKEIGTTSGKNSEFFNLNGQTLEAILELGKSILEGYISRTTNTSSLISKANKAFSYLLTTLPANAQAYLNLKAKQFGSSPAAIIQNLLESTLNDSQDVSYSLHKEASSKSSNEGGSKDKFELDPVQQFLAGRGELADYKLGVGSSFNIILKGLTGTLVSTSGEPLEGGSTMRDVQSSMFAPILKWTHATMGGEQLNSALLDRVIINSPLIIRMALPIDVEEKNTTGLIKPDILITKRVEEANAEIKENNITDYNKINEVYARHLLLPLYKSNGDINTIAYAEFAVIDALAELSAFKESPNLNYIEEVLDENQRAGFVRAMKNGDSKYSISEGILGWGKTSIYEGSVFIPIRTDKFNASLGTKNYFHVNSGDANHVMEEQLALERASKILSINISALD